MGFIVSLCIVLTCSVASDEEQKKHVYAEVKLFFIAPSRKSFTFCLLIPRKLFSFFSSTTTEEFASLFTSTFPTCRKTFNVSSCQFIDFHEEDLFN